MQNTDVPASGDISDTQAIVIDNTPPGASPLSGVISLSADPGMEIRLLSILQKRSLQLVKLT